MKYYENIVMKRHSCRGFADKKVGDDVLNELLTYYEDEESDLVDEIETELKFYIGTVWDELKRASDTTDSASRLRLTWLSSPMSLIIISRTPDTSLRDSRSR